MAKRIGHCINVECDGYKQDVEVEVGEEFVCPLCHQALKEGGKGKGKGGNNGGNKGGNGKKIAIIAAAVVALGGAIAGLYVKGCSNKEEVTPTDSIPPKVEPVLKDSISIMPNGDTLKITIDMNTGEEKDRVILKKKEEPTKPEPGPKPGPKPEPQPQPVRTLNLGYATYKGDIKNGKPHGFGTLTYKKAHQIVPSKDFEAQPGDRFEGEFRDGRIVSMGTWYHDGDQTAVKP